jgi:pyruvate dehydrogenase E2 component (dihydrolipoyllysine-residue acetyltransferase)
VKSPTKMTTPVQIPKASLSMEGGTIVRWMKSEGETVRQEEVLFELETDKSLLEVPSPASGVLRKIIIPSGAVEVGETVAWIGEISEALPDTEATNVKSSPEPNKAKYSERKAEMNDVPILRATPAARRCAKELGVDITLIRGTGPGGRILEEDVRGFVDSRIRTGTAGMD